MPYANLNYIANFIWGAGTADGVPRDVYVRGKYRGVILPMTIIHRLDAVLEATKHAVLEMKRRSDARGITKQDAELRQVAGPGLLHISLHASRPGSLAKARRLKADFEAYLDGFSP